MLKNLLQEVWRSVRPVRIEPPNQPETHLSPPVEFSSADRAQKERWIDELVRSLQVNGEDTEGWTRLGDWCLTLQRFSQAESAYRQALMLKPTQATAQEGLGLVLLQLQQFNEAFLRLEAACKAEPSRADAWVHWGMADLAMGNHEQAALKFQSAIDRDPKNPHAWQNLGLVAYHLGQIQSCIDAIREAVALRPADGLAHANLALAWRHKGDLEQAHAAAARATELKPGSARVWVVLAETLFDLADFAGCRSAIDRAIGLDPKFGAAPVALGKLLTAQRDWEGARTAFDRTLELQPGNADAEGGLAILGLLQQRWATAWDWHEARRRTQPAPVRNLPFPEWDGTARSGETVLVHAEQGLGDIILFASCLPDLQSRGVNCIVEVPPRMENLFARSFPGCRVVGNEQNRPGLAWLDRLPRVDRQLPIGSLPRWFRRSQESFPAHRGYLRADPQKVDSWRRRLDEEHPGRTPLVGLAWRGGLAITAYRHRTLQLRTLLSAFEGLSARWVNLQYGDIGQELGDCAAHSAGWLYPGLSGYADLDDLAGLTAACDAVVTVCSTQAHLTGALGLPGLVLVPQHPNWRYGAEGDRSVWYPSLKLARQLEEGAWDGPLNQARDWLLNLATVQGPR